MTDEKRPARPAVQYGPTGETVAANVKSLRTRRGMTIYALSGALAKIGRPITASAIAKIEKQQRQVTVDDLVALASALQVSPDTLLLPWTDHGDEIVEVTGAGNLPAADVWSWAAGSNPPRLSEVDPVGELQRFQADARPPYARPLLTASSLTLSESQRAKFIAAGYAIDD
ncbi:helix-turn-helix domain-containing protein [Streptomyces sp. NPDC127051]|uniref:helix-turn-helix domain-containing protein n=1 Tax=Streptomyces sp. NPDC127051 TaxID=3347119 RepID=UPI00366A2ADE